MSFDHDRISVRQSLPDAIVTQNPLVVEETGEEVIITEDFSVNNTTHSPPKIVDKVSNETSNTSILPENDKKSPHIVNNTGLVLWESTSAVITSHHLAAQDDDTSVDQIVFKILVPATNSGFLAINKGNESFLVDSFTQKDINEGRITFSHSGGGSLEGGFRFQVSDGVNTEGPYAFTITARSVMIKVIVNSRLLTFPQVQQSITRDHLFASTTDGNTSRPIVYNIVKGPSFGQIVLEKADGTTTPVKTFTQQDIDNKGLLYDQTAPLSNVYTRDDIFLEIQSPFVRIVKGITFTIDISLLPSTAGREVIERELNDVLIFHDSKAVLHEGSSLILDSTVIQKKKSTSFSSLVTFESKETSKERLLFLKIHQLPKHGWISMDHVNLTHELLSSLSIRTSSQQQRSQNWNTLYFDQLHSLVYHHDGSNSFNDSITFGIYLQTQTSSSSRQRTEQGNQMKAPPAVSVLLSNKTLNFTILPVHDEPLHLLTHRSSLTALQGESTVINSSVLATRDDDGIPSQVFYSIISGPENGFLYLTTTGDSGSPITLQPVFNFTQEDVDRGRLWFRHHHKFGVKPGIFHFKVNDVNSSPIYGSFVVKVSPVVNSVKTNSDVRLKQDSSPITLSPEDLPPETTSLKDLSGSTTPDPSRISSQFQPSDHLSKKTTIDPNIENGVNYLNIIITKSHLYAAIAFFLLASFGLLTLMRVFKLFKNEEDQLQKVDDVSKTKKSSSSYITPAVTASIHPRGLHASISPVPSSPASSSVLSRSLHDQRHHHQRTQSECSCSRKQVQQYKSNASKQVLNQHPSGNNSNDHCPLSTNKPCSMHQHHPPNSHSRSNTIHRSYHHHQHQMRAANLASEVVCDNKRCLTTGSSPAHGSFYSNGSQNLTPSGSCSPSTTGTDTGIGGCSSSLIEGGDQRTSRGANPPDNFDRNEVSIGNEERLLLPPPLPDVSLECHHQNFSGMTHLLQETHHLDVYAANTFGHDIPLTETRFHTGSQESNNEALHPLPPPSLYFSGNPEEEQLQQYRKSMMIMKDEDARTCFDSPVLDHHHYGHNISHHHGYNETQLFNRSDNMIIKDYDQQHHPQQQTNHISRHSTISQIPWREQEDHSFQVQNNASSRHPCCDENQMLLLLTDQNQKDYFGNKNITNNDMGNNNSQEELIQSPTQAEISGSRLASLVSSFQSPPPPATFQSQSCCANNSMPTTTTERDNMTLNVNLTSSFNPLSIASDHASYQHRSESSDRSPTMMAESGNNTLRRRVLVSNRNVGSTERSENSESQNTSQNARGIIHSLTNSIANKDEEDADAGNISSSTSASPSISLENRLNSRQSSSRLQPHKQHFATTNSQSQSNSSCHQLQPRVQRTNSGRRVTCREVEGEEQFWV